MIKITFSQEEMKALEYQRYHHPHPRVQKKMEALFLKSQGVKHKQICRLTGICQATLCSYLSDYKEGGIEKLKEMNFYKPQSQLQAHRASLEEYFRLHPPNTSKQAMAVIEEITGIKRSPTQIRVFLHSIGLKLRKVGMIPAKADVQAQAEFIKDQLEPRLAQAKEGERVVFFC